jgi:hypothetical protein
MFGFVGDGAAGRYWYLDSVSVVDVTAPTIELLQNPGFDNSTTALTDWTQYCTSTCGSDAGKVVTSGCVSGNCYMDHCNGGSEIDFLSQSGSTIIGHTYTISFWLLDSGSGADGASVAYVDLY